MKRRDFIKAGAAAAAIPVLLPRQLFARTAETGEAGIYPVPAKPKM